MQFVDGVILDFPKGRSEIGKDKKSEKSFIIANDVEMGKVDEEKDFKIFLHKR